jgi:phytol kinase
MLLPSWITPIPTVWLQLAIVGIWLGAIGLTAEWLHRRKTTSAETVRKVVHIGAGNVILFAWWFALPAWMGIAASVFFSVVTYLSYRVPILSSINGIGRKSLGTFFYAVSIGILIAWFWTIQQPQYAVLGVLIMTWGDGMAALVGQRFGKHPYKLWGIQKSWEGSLTMAVVSFIVSSLILLSLLGGTWQLVVISLIVALAATGLEAFSKYGVDNLTVPVGSAAIAFALSQLL